VIVIDSAVKVDALTTAPDTVQFRTRIRDEELQAPMLIDFAVVSALWVVTLGGGLSAARAKDAITYCADLAVHLGASWMQCEGVLSPSP